MSGKRPGWAEASLAQLGEEVRGSVVPSVGTTYELYSVPAFPTRRPEVLDGSEIGSAKRPVRPGDVLLCKINPRINRVWIVAEPLEDGREQIASTEYLVIRTGNADLSRYIMWYLQSPAFREWIKLSVEGATGSHTRAKSGPILRQRIPLPPPEEQRRIVEAVEKEFSRLDAGERSLRQAHLMSTHITGRIARYAIEKATDSVVETLESICPVFVDCAHRTPVYSEIGIPALRPRDVVRGSLNLEGAARVDEEEFATQTKRHVPCAGDVVYSRELSYGWAVVVPADVVLCMSQGMVLFRPDESVSADYLALVLNSQIGRDQATAAATGTAHPHVNLRDIRRYRIPVPSRREQNSIVELAHQRLSVLDATSTGIDRALRRSASLRRSILERAFRGELVQQNPGDEPGIRAAGTYRGRPSVSKCPSVGK